MCPSGRVAGKVSKPLSLAQEKPSAVFFAAELAAESNRLNCESEITDETVPEAVRQEQHFKRVAI